MKGDSIKTFYFISDICNLLVTTNGNSVEKIEFIKVKKFNKMKLSDFQLEVYNQLKEYFLKKRKSFSLPINLLGTKFQKKVWEQTAKIKYSSPLSYKQLAKNIGYSKASRAVGGALSKNPIPIIIPCHRVIGANGSLGGFTGGIELKKKLLKLERYFEFCKK